MWVRNVQREAKAMREWLDRLEHDAANETVIHAMLLMSLSESYTRLIYNAGMINGSELIKDGSTGKVEG